MKKMLNLLATSIIPVETLKSLSITATVSTMSPLLLARHMVESSDLWNPKNPNIKPQKADATSSPDGNLPCSEGTTIILIIYIMENKTDYEPTSNDLEQQPVNKYFDFVITDAFEDPLSA